jgi:hypothetical protein
VAYSWRILVRTMSYFLLGDQIITTLLRSARTAAILAPVASLAACTAPGVPQAMAGSQQAANGAIPVGDGQQTADLDGVPLQIFTYKPSGCAMSAILLVFHGLDRNAGPYRDDAVPLGQRFCMLVVAPLFDEARFSSWRYQRGGIVRDGAVQPAASWTVNLVSPRLLGARSGEPAGAPLHAARPLGRRAVPQPGRGARPW